MTDPVCKRCKHRDTYPFLGICWECTHHKHFDRDEDYKDGDENASKRE